MCGRTRCTLAPERLAQECSTSYSIQVDDKPAEEVYTKTENIGPGSKLPILRLPSSATAHSAGSADASATAQQAAEEPLAVAMQGVHWGLIPSFTSAGTKPDFFRMFNARCESVASKGVFSRLLKHKHSRCLVVVDGFYEWNQEHKVKQPYYIHMEDRALIFAGLCDTWAKGEGDNENLPSCTILTTEVSQRLAWLHTRQPVILPDAAACRLWLHSDDVDSLQPLYQAYNGPDLIWHAVTPALNKASYQGADCARPIKQNKVSSFFSQTQKGAAQADPQPAERAQGTKRQHADASNDEGKAHADASADASQAALENIKPAKVCAHSPATPAADRGSKAVCPPTTPHSKDASEGKGQAKQPKSSPLSAKKVARAVTTAKSPAKGAAGTKSLDSFLTKQ